MEKKILLLLPLVFFVLSTPPHAATFRVVPISDKLDWDAARAHCREHYSDLFNVRNQAQADMIAPYKGWIGMRWRSDHWRLSRKDEKAVFKKFKSGEPASDGYCAESHDETEWHSHLCSQIDSFICEDRLNLAQEEKTWEEALQHCRELQDGGLSAYDLASLPGQHQTVLDRMKLGGLDPNTKGMWVGLRFLAGEWLWMDGTRAHSPNLPECPDQQQHCGALGYDSQGWKTLNCSETRNFICNIRE
ncbi:hypothetical protein KUCAC02_002047 [Chaenocephalus aceratus]|uniref:Uncharacterized protein n=1 Tax=Chaenocephalus aceratus TaxID=36190 RepID=A0ACB9XTN0_CHAAC|nr:hypothetical protein KUCAC02_002047 [Chaenocephalus aceratus]